MFRLSRFGRQLPGLFDRFVDAADHVEGSFGQMVIFAIDHRLEALDRVFQLDELAGDAGEHFGHVEGLRQEALDLAGARSEEHTSELQSLMRISYAVFCLKKKNQSTI